jgi:hypothetical protein
VGLCLATCQKDLKAAKNYIADGTFLKKFRSEDILRSI